MKKNQSKFTVVGTNIEEVKRQNANSGMSYTELNEWFAQKMSEENPTNQVEFGEEISFKKTINLKK